MSYGMDLADSFRGAANCVDRILKGAKPSELAVQLPIRFELIDLDWTLSGSRPRNNSAFCFALVPAIVEFAVRFCVTYVNLNRLAGTLLARERICTDSRHAMSGEARTA